MLDAPICDTCGTVRLTTCCCFEPWDEVLKLRAMLSETRAWVQGPLLDRIDALLTPRTGPSDSRLASLETKVTALDTFTDRIDARHNEILERLEKLEKSPVVLGVSNNSTESKP